MDVGFQLVQFRNAHRWKHFRYRLEPRCHRSQYFRGDHCRFDQQRLQCSAQIVKIVDAVLIERNDIPVRFAVFLQNPRRLRPQQEISGDGPADTEMAGQAQVH